MQLSKKTVDILKNFATINQSIVVNSGKKIATMAIARNILAEAEVEEEFPTDFAIYNLNEFLAAISLFESPDLDFQDNCVKIKEKDSRKGGITYFYSNKSLIVYPTKSINMPDDIAVDMPIPESVLSKIAKASSVLGVGDVAIVGDAEGISLIVLDKKNSSSNDFEIALTDEPQKKEFTFFFKQENFKFIQGDYQMKISPKGIASFRKSDGSIQYAVALEAA